MSATKIKRILSLFENDERVVHIIGHNTVDVINTSDILGKNDNEVLYLGYSDGDEDYSFKFTEQGIADAKIVNGNLVMDDHEGDEVAIGFLEYVKYNLYQQDIE